MEGPGLIIGIGAVLLVIVFIGLFISIYNSLIRLLTEENFLMIL